MIRQESIEGIYADGSYLVKSGGKCEPAEPIWFDVHRQSAAPDWPPA